MTAEPHRSLQRLWLTLSSLGFLTLAVKARWLAGIDHAVSQAVAAAHTPFLDAAIRALTFFGSTPCLAAALIIMGAWWVSRGEYAALRTCLAAGAFGLAVQCALRLWVEQWRPDTGVMPASLSLWMRYEWAGFPSGHAFRSAFLYGWWMQALRPRRTRWSRAGVVVCSLLIVGVGITRVYLQRHWMTDVLGGWLVAAASLALAGWLRKR